MRNKNLLFCFLLISRSILQYSIIRHLVSINQSNVWTLSSFFPLNLRSYGFSKANMDYMSSSMSTKCSSVLRICFFIHVFEQYQRTRWTTHFSGFKLMSICELWRITTSVLELNYPFLRNDINNHNFIHDKWNCELFWQKTRWNSVMNTCKPADILAGIPLRMRIITQSLILFIVWNLFVEVSWFICESLHFGKSSIVTFSIGSFWNIEVP